MNSVNCCRHFAIALGLLPGMIAYAPAADQAYPTKAIRLVVPFTAGGGADLMGRALGQRLTMSLRQSVIIDNRAGAGGRIAAELVAKSQPDGYTLLLVTHSTLVFAPALYDKLGYDPIKDFAPVAPFASSMYLLVVHPSVRASSVRDLIALAKTEPGALKYASSGTGGLAHMGAELFNYMAGVKTLHVPYKGSAPGTIALVGGETDFMFSNILPALPMVKAGKLRALAVSGLKRTPALADVPTVDESGLPGYDLYIFFGLAAPARTPRAAIEQLYGAIAEALRSREVTDKLASDGAEPMIANPEEFTRIIKTETGKWLKVIRNAGIRGE